MITRCFINHSLFTILCTKISHRLAYWIHKLGGFSFGKCIANSIGMLSDGMLPIIFGSFTENSLLNIHLWINNYSQHKIESIGAKRIYRQGIIRSECKAEKTLKFIKIFSKVFPLRKSSHGFCKLKEFPKSRNSKRFFLYLCACAGYKSPDIFCSLSIKHSTEENPCEWSLSEKRHREESEKNASGAELMNPNLIHWTIVITLFELDP